MDNKPMNMTFKEFVNQHRKGKEGRGIGTPPKASIMIMAELWQQSNLARIKELEETLGICKSHLIELGFHENSATVAHIKQLLSNG